MPMRKARAFHGLSSIGPRIARYQVSRRSTSRCSPFSISCSCFMLGRMRMASHGVNMKAATSENSMATEPSTGIGRM